jgi:hypothetical protein
MLSAHNMCGPPTHCTLYAFVYVRFFHYDSSLRIYESKQTNKHAYQNIVPTVLVENVFILDERSENAGYIIIEPHGVVLFQNF